MGERTEADHEFQQQDILTGDEIISDSYDLKEVDGAVYEVDCEMITLGAVEVSTYTLNLAAKDWGCC